MDALATRDFEAGEEQNPRMLRGTAKIVDPPHVIVLRYRDHFQRGLLRRVNVASCELLSLLRRVCLHPGFEAPVDWRVNVWKIAQSKPGTGRLDGGRGETLL
jgi:hypothetical protein